MPDVSLSPVTSLYISAEPSFAKHRHHQHHHRHYHSSTSLVNFNLAENIKQSFYDGSHALPTDSIVCSPAMENQGWLKQKINTVNRYRNRGAHTDFTLSSKALLSLPLLLKS